MNSGAMIVFSNRKNLCSLCSNGRLQTRACNTTQVHRKVVDRQLKMRLNVPRPVDSRTQPTNGRGVGDGLNLRSVRVIEVMSAVDTLRY